MYAMVRQVFIGLGHIHSQRITHNDIKPSNLMHDSHGVIKIIDFGLAAPAGSEFLGKGGTSLYQAPEATGGDIVGDSRARDVFAAGLV